MQISRRTLLRWACKLCDSAVLIFSLYFSVRLFSGSGNWISLQEALQIELPFHEILFVGLLMIIWLSIFGYFGLYRQRYMSFMKFRTYEFVDLVKATSFGTLLIIGATFLAGVDQVGAEAIIIFWVTITIGTFLVRELLISILRQMRLHGRNLRHLLIVGTNKRAQEFADKISRSKELGYSLKGFVDEEWSGPPLPAGQAESLVAGFDDIGEYLKSHVVDEVLITLPIATFYAQSSCIVKICEEHGIVVHFVPGFDFLNKGSSCAKLDTIEGNPIITLIPPPMSGWRLVAKRLIDITGSAVASVLLSPVLILVSLLIKLTSPGPILFSQDRMGLNKRKFKMLKFRSMVQDAEKLQQSLEQLNEADGPVFKIKNDPRLTSIGAFIRRTSLDELPQLFNVLLGDMSLVGPRPLPLRDYDRFDQDWHRRRLSVRPGITCFWQLSGRNSIPFERWMELDMEYINNWSLWLDMKILVRTIGAVIHRTGAA